MKKLVWGVLVVCITGCKSTENKCDAYGMQDDINVENVESQKKFVTSESVK